MSCWTWEGTIVWCFLFLMALSNAPFLLGAVLPCFPLSLIPLILFYFFHLQLTGCTLSFAYWAFNLKWEPPTVHYSIDRFFKLACTLFKVLSWASKAIWKDSSVTTTLIAKFEYNLSNTLYRLPTSALLRGKLMPLNKILESQAETHRWALEMMLKGFRCGYN